MSDPRAIAIEYIEAVGQHRFERVEQLLHPDVEFHTAARTLTGAGPYLTALHKLAPVIVRNDITQVIVEGSEVCVAYDFVTDTSVGAVPSVERLTIEQGRIRSVRLLFHSLPWPKVLEELGQRATVAA